MQAYGYGASCSSPALSGHPFDGMGRADFLGRADFMGMGATAAQTAAAAQRKAALLAKQQANKVAVANRQAAAKAKKLVKVAGKTVATSNPQAASALHAKVTQAQSTIQNVMSLAAQARKTKSKADYQKALAAGNAAVSMLKEVATQPASPTAPAVAATTKLRGLGYFGSCVQNADGSVSDNGDGNLCTGATGAPGYPTATPTTYLPPTYSPGSYQTPVYGTQPVSTGFPIIQSPVIQLPTVVSNRVRSCQNGSNSAFCIVYNMSVDEQSQFQYVFQILQQMYAQLLTIVQQLMSELQSAQQQPYAASPYGATPYSPYGTTPYSPYGQQPYGDPSAQYGAYGQSPYGYGGQYQSPYSYGAPYSPGGDSSQIPVGYDTGGDASGGVPGDASQVFPGPGNSPGGGYPMMNTGGAQTGLISSDSLPSGADQQSGSDGGDDAAGIVPTAQSGPNLAPQSSGQQGYAVASSVNAPVSSAPQIIILKQGPGQSPYSDAGLPAGNKQNQPGLDPQEHDGSGLTGWY